MAKTPTKQQSKGDLRSCVEDVCGISEESEFNIVNINSMVLKVYDLKQKRLVP